MPDSYFEQNITNLAEVLQWARENLFQLLEELSEGTVIVDADSRVVWMNKRYAGRFGFARPEDATGLPIEEVIPGSRMREVVQTGQSILLDILQSTGEPLVVIRFPIRGEGGKLLGAIGFVVYDEVRSLSPLVKIFSQMQDELRSVRTALAKERGAKYSFIDFVGESAKAVELKALCRRAAGMESPVLLLGETGTGKELLAHAIHGASARAHNPLVSVNMGAIPESLLEAEFFGAAPGAYTGADRGGREGKLRVAEGGTLFLDEIGDLPLSMQGKLLRVLQEKEYEPVGSNKVRKADIRIIAATSANLAALVEEKRFRPDLYYRLNVLPVAIPPLRERTEDIPQLCLSLIQGIRSQTRTRCTGIDGKAAAALQAYGWPGNVRELRNILERAIMMHDKELLRAGELLPLLSSTPEEQEEPLLYTEAMQHHERHILKSALQAVGNSVPLAAKRLGLGRSTLYRKLLQYNIPHS